MDAFRMYAPASASSRTPRSSLQARSSKKRKPSGSGSATHSPTTGLDSEVGPSPSPETSGAETSPRAPKRHASSPCARPKMTHLRRPSTSLPTGGARAERESTDARPRPRHEARPSFASTSPSGVDTAQTDLASASPARATSRPPPAAKSRLVYLPRGTRSPSPPLPTTAVAASARPPASRSPVPARREVSSSGGGGGGSGGAGRVGCVSADPIHDAVTARLPPGSPLATVDAMSPYALMSRPALQDVMSTLKRGSLKGQRRSGSSRRRSQASYTNSTNSTTSQDHDPAETTRDEDRPDASASRTVPGSPCRAPVADSRTAHQTDKDKQTVSTDVEASTPPKNKSKKSSKKSTTVPVTEPESPAAPVPAVRDESGLMPLIALVSNTSSVVPHPPATALPPRDPRRSRAGDQVLLELVECKESVASLPALAARTSSRDSSVGSSSMRSRHSASDRPRAQEPLVPISGRGSSPSTSPSSHRPFVRPTTSSRRAPAISLNDAPTLPGTMGASRRTDEDSDHASTPAPPTPSTTAHHDTTEAVLDPSSVPVAVATSSPAAVPTLSLHGPPSRRRGASSSSSSSPAGAGSLGSHSSRQSQRSPPVQALVPATASSVMTPSAVGVITSLSWPTPHPTPTQMAEMNPALSHSSNTQTTAGVLSQDDQHPLGHTPQPNSWMTLMQEGSVLTSTSFVSSPAVSDTTGIVATHTLDSKNNSNTNTNNNTSGAPAGATTGTVAAALEAASSASGLHKSATSTSDNSRKISSSTHSHLLSTSTTTRGSLNSGAAGSSGDNSADHAAPLVVPPPRMMSWQVPTTIPATTTTTTTTTTTMSIPAPGSETNIVPPESTPKLATTPLVATTTGAAMNTMLPFSLSSAKTSPATGRGSSSLTSHLSHDGVSPNFLHLRMLSNTALYNSHVSLQPTPLAGSSTSSSCRTATAVNTSLGSSNTAPMTSTTLVSSARGEMERQNSTDDGVLGSIDGTTMTLPTLVPVASASSPVVDRSAAGFPAPGSTGSTRALPPHPHRPVRGRPAGGRSALSAAGAMHSLAKPTASSSVTSAAAASATAMWVEPLATAMTSLDDLMRAEDAPRPLMAPLTTSQMRDDDGGDVDDDYPDSSSIPTVDLPAGGGDVGVGHQHGSTNRLLPSSTVLASSICSAATLPPGKADSSNSLKRRGRTGQRAFPRASRTESSFGQQSELQLQYSVYDDDDDGEEDDVEGPQSTVGSHSRRASFSNTVMLGSPSDTIKPVCSQRDMSSLASSSTAAATSRRDSSSLVVPRGVAMSRMSNAGSKDADDSSNSGMLALAGGSSSSVPSSLTSATPGSGRLGRQGGSGELDMPKEALRHTSGLSVAVPPVLARERRLSSVAANSSTTTNTTTTAGTEADGEWTALPLNSVETDTFLNSHHSHPSSFTTAGHLATNTVTETDLPMSPMLAVLGRTASSFRGGHVPAQPPGTLTSILVGSSLVRPSSERALGGVPTSSTSPTTGDAAHELRNSFPHRLASVQDSPSSEPLIQFFNVGEKEVKETPMDGRDSLVGTANNSGSGPDTVPSAGRPSSHGGTASNTNNNTNNNKITGSATHRGVTPSFVDEAPAADLSTANAEFSPHGFLSSSGGGGGGGGGGTGALTHSMSLISRASLYCPAFPDVFMNSGTSVNSWRTSPSGGAPLRPSSQPFGTSGHAEGIGIRFGHAGSVQGSSNQSNHNNTTISATDGAQLSDGFSRPGSSPSYLHRREDDFKLESQNSLSLTALGRALLQCTSPTGSPYQLPAHGEADWLGAAMRDDVQHGTVPPLFVGQGQVMVDYMVAWQKRQQQQQPQQPQNNPGRATPATTSSSISATPHEGVWQPTPGFPFAVTTPAERAAHGTRAYSLFSNATTSHEKADDDPWLLSPRQATVPIDDLPPYSVDMEAAQEMLNRWKSFPSPTQALSPTVSAEDEYPAGLTAQVSKLMRAVPCTSSPTALTSPTAASAGRATDAKAYAAGAPKRGGNGFHSVLAQAASETDGSGSGSFSPGSLLAALGISGAVPDGRASGSGSGSGGTTSSSAGSGARGNGFFSLLTLSTSGGGGVAASANDWRVGSSSGVNWHSGVLGNSTSHGARDISTASISATTTTVANHSSSAPGNANASSTSTTATTTTTAAARRQRHSSSSSSSSSRPTLQALGRLGTSFKSGLSNTTGTTSTGTSVYGFQRTAQWPNPTRGSASSTTNGGPSASSTLTTVLSPPESKGLKVTGTSVHALDSTNDNNNTTNNNTASTATTGAGSGRGTPPPLQAAPPAKRSFQKRQTDKARIGSAAGAGPPSRRSGAIVQLREPSPSGAAVLNVMGLPAPLEGGALGSAAPTTAAAALAGAAPPLTAAGLDGSLKGRSTSASSAAAVSTTAARAALMPTSRGYAGGREKKSRTSTSSTADSEASSLAKAAQVASVGSISGSDAGSTDAPSPLTAEVPSPNYGHSGKPRRTTGRSTSVHSTRSTPSVNSANNSVSSPRLGASTGRARLNSTSGVDSDAPAGEVDALHLRSARPSVSRFTTTTISVHAPPSVMVTNAPASTLNDSVGDVGGAGTTGLTLQTLRAQQCEDEAMTPPLHDVYAAMNPNFTGTMNTLMSFMSPEDRSPDFLMAASEPHSLLLSQTPMEANSAVARTPTLIPTVALKTVANDSLLNTADAPALVPTCATTAAAWREEDGPPPASDNPLWITDSPDTSSLRFRSPDVKSETSTHTSSEQPVRHGVLSPPTVESSDPLHNAITGGHDCLLSSPAANFNPWLGGDPPLSTGDPSHPNGSTSATTAMATRTSPTTKSLSRPQDLGDAPSIEASRGLLATTSAGSVPAPPQVPPPPPSATTLGLMRSSLTPVSAALVTASARQSVGQNDFSAMLHKFNGPAGVNDSSVFGDLLPSVYLGVGASVSSVCLQPPASPSDQDVGPLPASATAPSFPASLSTSSLLRTIGSASITTTATSAQPPPSHSSDRTFAWRSVGNHSSSSTGAGAGTIVPPAVATMAFPTPLQMTFRNEDTPGAHSMSRHGAGDGGLVASVAEQSLSSVIPSFLYAPRELQAELQARGWSTVLRSLGGLGADTRRARHRRMSDGSTNTTVATGSLSISSSQRGTSLTEPLSPDAAAAPESTVLAMKATNLRDLLGLEPVLTRDGDQLRGGTSRPSSGAARGAGRRRLHTTTTMGTHSREQSGILIGGSRPGTSSVVDEAASLQPASRAGVSGLAAPVGRLRSGSGGGGAVEEDHTTSQYLQLPNRRTFSRGQTTGVRASGGSVASGMSNSSFTSSVLLHSDFNWKSDEHVPATIDTTTTAVASHSPGARRVLRGPLDERVLLAGSAGGAGGGASTISPVTSPSALPSGVPALRGMGGGVTTAATGTDALSMSASHAARDGRHGLLLVTPTGHGTRGTSGGGGGAFGHLAPTFRDTAEISLRSGAITPEASPPPSMAVPSPSLDEPNLLWLHTFGSSAQNDMVVITTPAQSATARLRAEPSDAYSSTVSDAPDRQVDVDSFIAPMTASSSATEDRSARAAAVPSAPGSPTSPLTTASAAGSPHVGARKGAKVTSGRKSRTTSTGTRRVSNKVYRRRSGSGAGVSSPKLRAPSSGGSGREAAVSELAVEQAATALGDAGVTGTGARLHRSSGPHAVNLLLSPPFTPFGDPVSTSVAAGVPASIIIAATGAGSSSPTLLPSRRNSSISTSPMAHSPLMLDGEAQRLRLVPPPAAPSNTLNPRVSLGRDSAPPAPSLALQIRTDTTGGGDGGEDDRHTPVAPRLVSPTTSLTTPMGERDDHALVHTDSWMAAETPRSHSSGSLSMPMLILERSDKGETTLSGGASGSRT